MPPRSSSTGPTSKTIAPPMRSRHHSATARKIPPANFFPARRFRRPSLKSDGDEGRAVKKIHRTRPLRADSARLPDERRRANLSSNSRDNNRSGVTAHGWARKEICALCRARPVAAGGQTLFVDFPTMNKPQNKRRRNPAEIPAPTSSSTKRLRTSGRSSEHAATPRGTSVANSPRAKRSTSTSRASIRSAGRKQTKSPRAPGNIAQIRSRTNAESLAAAVFIDFKESKI